MFVLERLMATSATAVEYAFVQGEKTEYFSVLIKHDAAAGQPVEVRTGRRRALQDVGRCRIPGTSERATA